MPWRYDPAAADFLFGSYFDGHFAITPFASVWNPSAFKRPFRTTSASSLKVSGTTPVYDALTTLPLFWTLNLYSRESRLTRIDPGTTNPWSCSRLPSHACGLVMTSSTCL